MKNAKLFAGCLVMLLWSCNQSGNQNGETEGQTGAPEVYVRQNASTDKGAADLAAMAVALKQMKALPCENPISWYYQGAIHWVPDTVKNGNPFCPSYQSVADTLKAWDNCTHISGDANSDYQFLIWHRLYIWHFEKIIRSLSGKADFALPYWRYVDPGYRIMPGELRSVQSALYNSERLDSLNAGDSISSYFARFSLDSAMVEANEAKTYSVFNDLIDAAPHGAMHDYIGGGWSNTPMFNSIYQAGPYTDQDTLFGWMAHVPSAGFDPVFWLHHSNIDFLWNEWENSANGERPDSTEFTKYPWHFVFPEPDGTFVTYTMQEAYNKAFYPDYVYADAAPMIALNTEKHNKLVTGAQLVVPKESLVHEESPLVQIGKGTTVLPLTGGLKAALLQGANKMSQSDVQQGDFIIKIKVSFGEEPTGGLAVFLSDGSQTSGQGQFIGMMTFFGAAHHAGHSHHPGPLTKTFTFDATNELLKSGATPHLVFQKIGGTPTGLKVENIAVYQY